MLRDLSATIPAGASCVAGPSGSGKSTLLRLLNRLADPDAGVVRYRGRDVREYDPLALRREVCLVPQLPALLEGTVADNVALRRAARRPRCRRRARCSSCAGLDASFADRDASQLSVGEQQRVMLARALALEPAVLLLDEPTSALDEAARDAVERTLLRPARRARPLAMCWSPTTSARPRAWPTGCCGSSSAAAWSAQGRERAAAGLSVGDRRQPRQLAATLVLVGDRGRRLDLAARRPGGGHRRRGRALVRPADRDRLRDQLHLRPGPARVRGRADQRSWSCSARSPPAAAPARCPAPSGRCWSRSRSPATTTLVLVVALGVFEPKPRFLVPVGGMVVGNSMTAAAVALNRLGDEVRSSARPDRGDARARRHRDAGDAARHPAQPALGDDPADRLHQDDRASSSSRARWSARCSPAPTPTDAVRLQLILLWTLLGQRRARGADRDRARLPQLLHSRPPAARPAAGPSGQAEERPPAAGTRSGAAASP